LSPGCSYWKQKQEEVTDVVSSYHGVNKVTDIVSSYHGVNDVTDVVSS
jgi:hypothetical protein